MKTKVLAIVEIAVVLCSVFLVAIPAVAAGQNQEMQKASTSAITTASEDEYVLDIYGNANEDDTIDMGDVVYTKLAIFGKKPKTKLCDAKYDGRINVLDVIQTKLIILGKEKELTIVDTADRIVTVKKPVKTIVMLTSATLETLRTLKVPEDIIVGVTEYVATDFYFRQFIGEALSVGTGSNPDVEAILNLHPDAVFRSASTRRVNDTIQNILESAGITVLYFKCQKLEIYSKEAEKLGYIFDKEEETEEYLDWLEKLVKSIKEKVEESIPEEDKPKVYYESYKSYTHYGEYAYITPAGGEDIIPDVYGSVDPEAIIDRDPDIIVKVAYRVGGYELDADDTTELEEIREEIMSRPELQNVKAVKKGKVYTITVHLLSYLYGSGCRYPIHIAYLAKWFHPELFEDLDPKAIHQEYLTRFQGLDIDLDEKGVFVYPEPS